MLSGVTTTPTPEKGGGFLSSIMGLLGGAGGVGAGAGISAVGGSIIALLTALPAAIPGILTALGAIVVGAAALSLAIGIVVKTISFLKDDFIEIFPIIDKFAELFIKVAKEIIPMVYNALANFVATILPPLLDGLTTFASVVLPAIIGAVNELINSPGFKFIVGALVPVLSQIIDVISNLLSELVSGIKSIFTDTKDALVSLFENIKQIIVPIIEGIKDIIVAPVESIKEVFISGFENVKEVIVAISSAISSAINGIMDIIVAPVESIKEVFISIFENIKEVIVAILPAISSAIDKIYDGIVYIFSKAKEIFEDIPTIIDKTLNSIKDFANNVSIGKISAVAAELTALGLALIGLTGGSVITNIANFFTGGGPFAKIIEFQNNLNESKLKSLSYITDLAKNVSSGRIGAVAAELKQLADAFAGLTGGSLLKNATDFFTGGGPFAKIIDFQNNLNESKLKLLSYIKDFVNNVSSGRIGAVAAELKQLADALLGLTGGSVITNIANFFTGEGPFAKIIEFQNNLNESKLKLLENLAPSLQKLIDIDTSQLKGLSTILNELMDQSLQIASTVDKIFAGKGIFNRSGGILELVDRLEKSKQGAENTISNVNIKTSEAQKQIAELQLKEAVLTNTILSKIYKKMDAFADMPQKSNATAKKLAGLDIDATMALQFTSNNTRQQIVQSGNSI